MTNNNNIHEINRSKIIRTKFIKLHCTSHMISASFDNGQALNKLTKWLYNCEILYKELKIAYLKQQTPPLVLKKKLKLKLKFYQILIFI